MTRDVKNMKVKNPKFWKYQKGPCVVLILQMYTFMKLECWPICHSSFKAGMQHSLKNAPGCKLMAVLQTELRLSGGSLQPKTTEQLSEDSRHEDMHHWSFVSCYPYIVYPVPLAWRGIKDILGRMSTFYSYKRKIYKRVNLVFKIAALGCH